MIDLHNDFLTEIKEQDMQKKYIENISKTINYLCCPIWTTNLKNAKNYIKNKKNIVKNYKSMQICIEDVGFLQHNDFNFLLDICPKYVGLVWNYDNNFGGGAYGINGLSKNGEQIVKFLQHNNIVVDTAHMNYKTFFDYVNITQKPIFCSHTGFCGVVNDKRNIKDSQIDLIVKSNGIVGLYFVGKYIANNKIVTSDDVVKNIDYFVQKFGKKNLAIGSDFFGTTDLPKDLLDYGQIDIVKQKLLKIGYKIEDIDDIFINNAKKFLNL